MNLTKCTCWILLVTAALTLVVIFRMSNMGITSPPVKIPEPVDARIASIRSTTTTDSASSSTTLDTLFKLVVKTANPNSKKQLGRMDILGTVEKGKKYAVFSAAFGTENALNYAFDLPLTALSWKRIGYGSIVLLVGSLQQWTSDEVFHQVLSYLRQQASVVLFLEAEPQNAVMLSQVARMFVCSLVPDFVDSSEDFDDVYLVTSDADLWPLQAGYYDLPENKTILSTNSECCGTFVHKQRAYKMLPMANIGMTLKTWLEATKRDTFSPHSVDDLLAYFSREFGKLANASVIKGENVGWYMDQRMISMLVGDWSQKSGGSDVHYVRRNVGLERIDRSGWSVRTLQGKVDAHILTNIYQIKQWGRMTPLLELMYGKESEEFKWCQQYAEEVRVILEAKQKTEAKPG